LKQPQEVAAAPSGREPGYSDGGALKVLFVGRLSRYKGLDYLIRAVQAVPGVEVIVAGEGEEQRRLAALVDRCRLGAAVRLVGGVSEEAKGRLLDAADVLCLPSTSRHEAFGLVLVEAMARGTPVVATRVPGSGMSWVIGDSGAGWTVEPQNVVQLADLLARLRDSTSVREEARRAALDNFRKRFQIADVALRIDQVYQEVLTVA
jgi:glycosyltransferase involved in cell wall biosynthesis